MFKKKSFKCGRLVLHHVLLTILYNHDIFCQSYGTLACCSILTLCDWCPQYTKEIFHYGIAILLLYVNVSNLFLVDSEWVKTKLNFKVETFPHKLCGSIFMEIFHNSRKTVYWASLWKFNSLQTLNIFILWSSTHFKTEQIVKFSQFIK